MGDLDRIVQVTITRQTTVPSVAGFDIILVADEFLEADVTPAFTERVREYTGGANAIITEIGTQFGTSNQVYWAASKILAQNPSVNDLYIGRKLTGVDGTETWTAALAAMQIDNPNWYGLIPITRTLAEQQLVADWVETNKKLCGISSNDANVVDATGDIAEYINTNNYDRSFVIYHPDSDITVDDPFPAGAWMGKQFPTTPGSSTWKFKTLTGVAAYNLTGSQITAVEGKEGNYYTEIAGVSVTQNGTVGSGEFIDIIRGIDKLELTMQNNIFTLLINVPKVPYTNEGIQGIVAEVKSAIQESVDEGLLTVGYVVTAPDVADIPAADKGNRILPDIEFTATVQGAIHVVQINGVVSL